MRRNDVFKTFISSGGREYELQIEPTEWTRVCHIERFVEDERGRITAEPTGWQWDGLMEMTHDLRLVILGWRSDCWN